MIIELDVNQKNFDNIFSEYLGRINQLHIGQVVALVGFDNIEHLLDYSSNMLKRLSRSSPEPDKRYDHMIFESENKYVTTRIG